jgi:DNA invertase Pin-like site-specific DNA recombinase
MIVGYARVSTDGQTLDAQQAELRSAGAEKVYSEKISGAVTDRTALAKAIAALGNGDTLIVTKLDRLARSTRDLLNTLDAISKAGAAFKSLGDSWADTTTPAGKLMLTVLGGLAEYERHLILARTSEGRQRAQARGVRFGRKLKLTAHQQKEALARRACFCLDFHPQQNVFEIIVAPHPQGRTFACALSASLKLLCGRHAPACYRMGIERIGLQSKSPVAAHWLLQLTGR